MAVERPTFSESWYRVADLRPSLRSTVQVHRQHFRGQMWHVLQDPASNQFFRLNSPAYTFVAMLNGRQTVAEVWRACNEELGDEAPTQGEAIQLLGQLYTSNLLQAEMPPDSEGLLKRYRKRRVREIQGYVTNLLFIRIPLIDPDHFLERWVGVFGRVFTWYGLAVWLMLVGAGLFFVAGRASDLAGKSLEIFDPGNLPWLYVALVIVKVFHEFGHAFACKTLGRRTGRGGEIHVMGVMFLVFMPLPYVDASSAWAFRSKWHRLLVGAGGMLVELAIAAVAAIIWANTSEGAAVHAICYNVMFLASVSTVLFNGNPLLRYDAYYILSDLLEIPNLAQRSRQYIYYLVRRYAWSVRRAVSPAHSWGERVWFVIYGVASTLYRVFIFAVILLFLTNRLPEAFAIVAVVFGLVAAFTWLCVPVGKFIRYLATSNELDRVRPRAVVGTLCVAVAILVAVGFVPAADRIRVEGIVEPIEMEFVHADEDGFIQSFLPSGSMVQPGSQTLVRMRNRDMEVELERLEVSLKELHRRKTIAGDPNSPEPAAVQVLDKYIAHAEAEIQRLKGRLAKLKVRAPLAGRWVAPDIDKKRGAYVRKGDRLGLVYSPDRLMIRTVVGQDDKRLIDSAEPDVQMRVRGCPDVAFDGQIMETMPAGRRRLPSAALGYSAGGPIPIDPKDPKGVAAAERFFEVLVAPDEESGVRLFPEQRVVARFTLPDEPLALQWWRSLMQLLQRRFRI